MKPTQAQAHAWRQEWRCNDIPGYLNDHLVNRAFAAGMEAAAQVCEQQRGETDTMAVAKGCAAAIRKAKEES